MSCRRCRGLMIKEVVGCRQAPMTLWRCYCCGNRTDLLIEVNRWRCRPPAIVRSRKALKTLFLPVPAAARPAPRHEYTLLPVLG